MKKVIYGLFALAILTACSKDEDAPSVPKQGQYVAEYGNITAAVTIDSRVTLTVYTDKRYTYQDTRTGGRQSGSWPVYTYTFSDNASGAEVVLRCTYSDPQNFTATSAGGVLPSTLQFRYDSRVLDANGDGVLDN